MKIRKTKPEELQDILPIFEIAKAFMVKTGNPNQWTATYPSTDMIEKDIANGESYVCVQEGEIVATFAYSEAGEETYRSIDGKWLNDKPYGVIHRVASSGKVKGVFSCIAEWAWKQNKNLKIDTHRDNKVMQRVILKNEFTYCGIIHLKNGDERLAYQKAEKE